MLSPRPSARRGDSIPTAHGQHELPSLEKWGSFAGTEPEDAGETHFLWEVNMKTLTE